MSDCERSVRILIADAHPMFCDALRDLLEQQPDFQVVGEAADGSETIEKVKQLMPDLLLLDLEIPQMSGLEVLRCLSGLAIEPLSIVLAGEIEKPQVVEALKFGARGVILKDVPTSLLFKGVRAVLRGEYWVAHGDVAELVGSLRAGMPTADLQSASGNGSLLSRRELEIVSAIVEGCTNKDIAQNLSLSEQTVKHHLTNIYAKVGVSNRLELAFYAVHHNLAS
jgi:two-component system, NarL family, nitrate/nitrite response regulator NarL